MAETEQDIARQILADLESGEISAGMKMALAQGLMPLEQDDLVRILCQLVNDEDADIAKAAVASLDDFPESIFVNIAESPNSAPSLLHSLARLRPESREVLQPMVLNRSTEDRTIEMLARHCTVGQILGLLAQNQERLLRRPELFDILLGNRAMPAFSHQRLTTYRAELMEQGKLRSATRAGSAACNRTGRCGRIGRGVTGLRSGSDRRV